MATERTANSQENAASLYTKTANHKVTIMRLSSSANQFGQYCYALTKHSLPKEAHILGNEGRQIFYSPKLVGSVSKEMDTEVALVKRVSTKTGEVQHLIVLAKSEEEKNLQANVAKNVQNLASKYGVAKRVITDKMLNAEINSMFAPSAPSEDASQE